MDTRNIRGVIIALSAFGGLGEGLGYGQFVPKGDSTTVYEMVKHTYTFSFGFAVVGKKRKV